MSEFVFGLEGATVRVDDQILLRPTDWSLRDRAVTVLLGPAGTGKSTLVRALAGVTTSADVVVGGRIVHRHRAVDPRAATPGVRFFAQALSPASAPYALSDIAACDAPTMILDEPDRVVPTERHDELAEALARHAQRRAVLLVTHDVGFARRVAHDAALLCAGSLLGRGSARDFFETPSSDLVRRFVRDGNCWPAASAPELPRHFRWVEPGKLAGMGRPGLLRGMDEDLAAIALVGIRHLVSLTQTPIPPERLRSFGLEGRHLPIRDMDVPSLHQAATLCGAMSRAYDRGEPIAIHCDAGLGRTGTLLAALLVWRGATPQEALEGIRRVERSFVQTPAQERFVERFALSLAGVPA